jgi:hypothetical protein
MKQHGQPVETIGDLVHHMGANGRSFRPRPPPDWPLLYDANLAAANAEKPCFAARISGNFVTKWSRRWAGLRLGSHHLECGVVKFFTARMQMNYALYVPDRLSDVPSMGVELQRQGTIANGCTHCDFRFGKGDVT